MLIPFLLLALQQGTPATAVVPPDTGFTTPPSRDTVGYWQQRTRYRVVARLDEARQALTARGTLTYVNRSPDVLTELRLHQYLNAFRPASAWSRDDAREGRVRFQHLPEQAQGYERFTAPVTVDGTPVTVTYPGAPDSTVVRIALPRPLAPGDSVAVELAWEARPSLVARRQGRRGRHYDFAHWYPRIAVYDRGGWQDNALRPAGEFYGEFGEFDVTLVLRDDQVIGTTGVVVSGDPGWARVNRGASAPVMQRDAYGPPPSPQADVAPAAGEKVVRIVARDVHHFAFSVSPDYRYEGGAYVRPPVEWARWPLWDTVPVHVLYRPGDEREWGGGQAVERTVNALRWLEQVFGPYAYPQVTNLHRLDGGGTEFPMMMMNGTASQGLILHEGGHIYAHGILANNEWRSGWMDEGLTSYQTSWAQGLTRHERARDTATFPVRIPTAEPRGYAGLALRPTGPDAHALAQWRAVVEGRAEPIGTRADRFHDFATYNGMIYSRAEMMYGALRDAIGDTAFTAFLRGYYARWGLKHVDEAAMRAEAERAAGRDLGWFFDQWVHRVGLVDYALTSVRTHREGDEWVTRAGIRRRGDYRHPMPVGVRTSTGWTIVRGDPMRDQHTVEIRTSEEPREVRLDPHRTTEDWYRPNDVRDRWLMFATLEKPRYVFDWPLLEQSSADRAVLAWGPLAWTQREYDAALGVRFRGNYRGIAERMEAGYAFYTSEPRTQRCPLLSLAGCDGGRNSPGSFQWYTITENSRRRNGPAMGLRLAFGELDGVTIAEVRKRWDQRPFGAPISHAASREVWARYTRPYAIGLIDADRWSGGDVLDVGAASERYSAVRRAGQWRRGVRAQLSGGSRGRGFAYVAPEGAPVGTPLERRFDHPGVGDFWFAIGQIELSLLRRAAEDRTTTFARSFLLLATDESPPERLPTAAMRSPTDNFFNHWLRPDQGLLSRNDIPFIVPGGGGLRGYERLRPARGALTLNAEHAVRLSTLGGGRRPRLFGTAFTNVGAPIGGLFGGGPLAEAGVGLALRGPLFDRELRLRLDLPLWLSDPILAISDQSRSDNFALRFSFSAGELW